MTASPRPPGQPTVARTHRQILVVFAGLMVAMLLPAMNMTLVATALPTIVGDLGGLSQLSWVITAYLLTSTVAVPLVGKISDLYGRKPLFQLAIVVFAAGSVLSGLATSMGQLIVFRGLQGVGGGALMALTQAIIGDVVSPRQRGRYQGYLGAVFAFASVAGPLLGGSTGATGRTTGATGTGATAGAGATVGTGATTTPTPTTRRNDTASHGPGGSEGHDPAGPRARSSPGPAGPPGVTQVCQPWHTGATSDPMWLVR